MKYLTWCVSLLFAQDQWKSFRPFYPSAILYSSEIPRLAEPAPIRVEWKVAPSAQSLYDKVLQYNRTAVTVPGYRIQLITTAVRAEADSMRFFLLENYPEQSVYMLYEAPLYKLRVGDFLDRKEAEVWLERYRQVFSGAFIVPDKILRP
ncbi:MAG: SPOR domain-containing protein [Bacteroidia bacterium]|nr:SPOR domain-containing protein [Bacteroidia bacterium]